MEIGLARTGFLHASDVLPPHDAAPTAAGEEPNIRDLLREGDTVLVQVVKDQLGTKGARLTTFITMPSRYLVLLPKECNLGVSGRIESDDERARLKQVMTGLTVNLPGTAISSGLQPKASPRIRCALMSISCTACGTWSRTRRRARPFRPWCTRICRLPSACCATS